MFLEIALVIITLMAVPTLIAVSFLFWLVSLLMLSEVGFCSKQLSANCTLKIP